MIKLVAFDWNGTLLADTQTIVDCTNLEIKSYGLKPQTIKEYRETFVIPVNLYFKNIGVNPKLLEKHSSKFAEIFHENYEELVKRCRTRKGARKLLSHIANNKMRSVIFSNHSAEKVRQQCDRLKISSFFDAILGNDHTHDAYTVKGKEKRLIDHIKRSKTRNSEVLIIGDTDEEIIIGHDMGSKTIAITNGHSTTLRLRAAKPDYLINNLEEVIGIIKKLN